MNTITPSPLQQRGRVHRVYRVYAFRHEGSGTGWQCSKQEHRSQGEVGQITLMPGGPAAAIPGVLLIASLLHEGVAAISRFLGRISSQNESKPPADFVRRRLFRFRIYGSSVQNRQSSIAVWMQVAPAPGVRLTPSPRISPEPHAHCIAGTAYSLMARASP